ncbi:MAG: flagellar hook-length control protein FliK [Armatimonadota bacterium]
MIALPVSPFDVLPNVDQAGPSCEITLDLAASFAGLLMVMQQQPQAPAPALPTDLAALNPVVGGMLKPPASTALQLKGIVVSLPVGESELDASSPSTEAISLQRAASVPSPAAISSIDAIPAPSEPSAVHPAEPAMPPTLVAPVQQMSAEVLAAAGLMLPSEDTALPAATPVVALQAPPPKVETDVVAILSAAAWTVTKTPAATAHPVTTLPPRALSAVAPEQPDAPQKASAPAASSPFSDVVASAGTRAQQPVSATLAVVPEGDAAAAPAPPIPTMPVDAMPEPVASVAVAPVPPKAPLPSVVAPATEVVAMSAAVGVRPVTATKRTDESSENTNQPSDQSMPERAPLSAPAPQVFASPSALLEAASEPVPAEVASANGVRPAGAAPPDTEAPIVTHLRLELAPPLLGEVVLELRHEHDEIAATATVERPASLETLKLVQVQVQQVLADQGIHVGSFEVSCRDGRQGEEHPAPAHQGWPERPEPQASPQPRRAVAARASTTLVDLYA